MKRHTGKNQTLLLALGLTLGMSQAWSQDFGDDLFEGGSNGVEVNQVNMNFEGDRLDVNGTYRSRPRRPDRAEMAARRRRALEKQNEVIVRKKMEDIRMQQEKEMTERLGNLFNGKGLTVGKKGHHIDSVNASLSAQSKGGSVEAELNVEINKGYGYDAKVTPYGSYMNVSGDGFDYENSLGMGVTVDAMVNKYFDIGVGFNYGKFKLEDNINNFYTGYNYNYYAPTYNNAYGTGRIINFTQMNLDLHGKYYILRKKAIRPYFGAGLGINRVKLEYDKNTKVSYGYGYYGEEEFSDNYFSIIGLAGTDISFNKNFGMNIEGRISKGLSSSDNENLNFITNPAYNRDQYILNDQGEKVMDAMTFSLNMGVYFAF